MASETWVQGIVHKLEEGGWVKYVRLSVVVAFCLFMVQLWMFRANGFKGLSQANAMDQAQIAREITRGNGFSTKFIRPAAIHQFQAGRKHAFNIERTPDTYQAPLNPLILAVSFKVMESVNAGIKKFAGSGNWYSDILENFTFDAEMSSKTMVWAYDKIVVSVQLLFMFAGVLVNYLTAKRMFDQRLAVFVAWMLLVCQTLWNFSMSGLPQNVMLFFFACAAYALVRALEARTAGTRTWLWLAGCGAAFGFLALTHGLTMWMFAGAVTFTLFVFKPRWQAAGALIGAFAVLYLPWVVHMQRACGSPAGIASYTYLSGVRGTESSIMRSMDPPLKDVSPWHYRAKLQNGLIQNLDHLYDSLGRIAMAPLFFVALLHVFKRPETQAFRWAILLMWLAALLGMALTGAEDHPAFVPFTADLESNDLHILFAPLMTAYGLAFVLVMWSRLGINIRLIRFGFLALIFLISGAPFLFQFIELNSPPRNRVQWPPYAPPIISMLHDWTNEREVIMSDMPWAVAWYADRKSLWLTTTIKEFTDLNDYNQLNGGIVGLYLTPFTHNRSFGAEIMDGDYKEWGGFITHQVSPAQLKDFVFKAGIPLPINGESMFFSDRDRWSSRED
jgi:hypothetical protein